VSGFILLFRLAGVHAATLAVLAGCATQPELPPADSAEPGIESEPATAPEEDYSYQRAVALLVEGRTDPAERMLKTRLEAVPGDDSARELLRQIQADPTEYLGESSFEYEVKPGESLSVLADRFLGNHRLFIVLARYNDIETPSLLRVGQALRIPGNYRDDAAPSRTPTDREEQARAYLADSRPRQVLELYAGVDPDSLSRDELTLLGDAHQRWIERALSSGNLDTARERLDAAQALAPADGGWSDRLGWLEGRITAEAAYRDGLRLRELEPAAAAQAFNRALSVDPEHVRARESLSRLRDNAVPKLHQEAVILYRHQDLDEAIDLWNQILAISPDFEPAQAYRARARELRRRLEELD